MSGRVLSPDPPEYRRCVGILLLNQHSRAWVGRRRSFGDEGSADHRWQLPQGGIDRGEGPKHAAFREMEEETGTKAADLLAEHPGWLRYDFPAGIQRRKRAAGHRTWRGQTQKWFAFRFRGTDDLFVLDRHHPEFDDWRWADLDELPNLIIPFKRDVYLAVVDEFRSL